MGEERDRFLQKKIDDGTMNLSAQLSFSMLMEKKIMSKLAKFRPLGFWSEKRNKCAALLQAAGLVKHHGKISSGVL